MIIVLSEIEHSCNDGDSAEYKIVARNAHHAAAGIGPQWHWSVFRNEGGRNLAAITGCRYCPFCGLDLEEPIPPVIEVEMNHGEMSITKTTLGHVARDSSSENTKSISEGYRESQMAPSQNAEESI